MTEMVERVAQAIRDCSSQRDTKDWERIKEIDREFWRDFARAAIAVMREEIKRQLFWNEEYGWSRPFTREGAMARNEIMRELKAALNPGTFPGTDKTTDDASD